MPYSQHTPSPVIDQRQANWVDSYEIEVPNDGSIHVLNERDFGYFTVADDPVGSDRALRAVALRNLETDDARILLIGGDGATGRVASPLFPGNPAGEERVFEVDKLSSVAVFNNSGADITLNVVLMDIDV